MTTSDPPKKATSTPLAKPKAMTPERLIVRLLIGGLFVVMAIELFAYSRLLFVHYQLSGQLQKAEQENHRITQEVIDKIFSQRKPDETKNVKVAVGTERYDIYYFWGLLKERPLCVHYGVEGLHSQPEVIEVTTIIPDEVLAN